MAVSYEETGKRAVHSLSLVSREKLSVSGVEDVASFDESCISLQTTQGQLILRGEGLHIDKLSIQGGELSVTGRIDAMSYEERTDERRSLLSRLFG